MIQTARISAEDKAPVEHGLFLIMSMISWRFFRTIVICIFLCAVCSSGSQSDKSGVDNEDIEEIWVRAYIVDSKGNEITFDKTLGASEGIQNAEFAYDQVINILRTIHEKIESDGDFTYNLYYYGGRGTA